MNNERSPGLLQHVIVRGIERRNIFRTNVDRRDVFERLSKLLVATGRNCYDWALSPIISPSLKAAAQEATCGYEAS